MIWDFSQLLQFNPRLVNVLELLDTAYEEIEDVDFVRWEKEALVVQADFYLNECEQGRAHPMTPDIDGISKWL